LGGTEETQTNKKKRKTINSIFFIHKKKLRDLSLRKNYTERVSIFADTVCHAVSVTDPYGRILGFLDRSRYFFYQLAPQLYSRWTPFQTHYFTENLVAPGIEPGPMDL
jgi:hypothetical protein